MYRFELTAELMKIRDELFPRLHTWFLIDGIMWHIAERYHPLGISSRRCIMSCVLDPWSQVAPIKPVWVYPGMSIVHYWWTADELIAELQRRPKMHNRDQMVFPNRELQVLTFEEITILTLEVMRRGSANLINYHKWYGLCQTMRSIKSLLNYFGKSPMADKFRFLPRRMFGRELPNVNKYVKSLIDELESRRDLMVMHPFEGLVPAEKQTPFE